MIPSRADNTDEYGVKYRLVSPGGVLFSELNGSAGGNFSPIAGERKIRYHVPWKTHQTFLGELLGGLRVIGFQVLRFPPDNLPWNPALYCLNVDVEPIGRIKLGGFNHSLYTGGCILNCTYKTPAADQEVNNNNNPTANEIQLATETKDFAIEHLSVDGNSFYYSNGVDKNLRSDSPVTIRVGSINIEYARHFVINVPESTIDNLTGKVNSVVFAGKAIEAVLFLGAQQRRVVSTSGPKAYELTYRFAVRTVRTRTASPLGSFDTRAAGVPAGWNRVWVNRFDYKTGGTTFPVDDWIKILTLNGDKPVYESGDFNQLFNPNST